MFKTDLKNQALANLDSAVREYQFQVCSLEDNAEKLLGCIQLTKQYSDGCLKVCNELQLHAPKNYKQFNEDQKRQTAALINHVNALSEMLRAKIE